MYAINIKGITESIWALNSEVCVFQIKNKQINENNNKNPETKLQAAAKPKTNGICHVFCFN